MSQTLTIHHELAEVVIKAGDDVNQTRLKKLIRNTLDQYQQEDRIPAQQVHDDAKARHGENYQTPGYYLRLYRLRADMTQADLAKKTGIRQHHLSEMENNKRSLGKANAKKLAVELNCDYRNLM
ncbi:helix-turn-helix transcriptional regulator [Marinicella gelatinilytica]|uniref:helix-turn-helix transcriptional regulator n=1 Tax=Marinicella gelatinilytica TaxID=2996017 RepID=UPI002260C440|nr:helix-turn-helix transcriptional regulator [Marinicella gelatinilytica]MCX7545355.1 helix-turn-helix transcriptional regulator [Marinicella gelatinilytica]